MEHLGICGFVSGIFPGQRPHLRGMGHLGEFGHFLLHSHEGAAIVGMPGCQRVSWGEILCQPMCYGTLIVICWWQVLSPGSWRVFTFVPVGYVRFCL